MISMTSVIEFCMVTEWRWIYALSWNDNIFQCFELACLGDIFVFGGELCIELE